MRLLPTGLSSLWSGMKAPKYQMGSGLPCQSLKCGCLSRAWWSRDKEQKEAGDHLQG